MTSKITNISTHVAGNVCVVTVRTDDGLEGIGQVAPSEPEITAQVLHRLVARHFLGRDPWDWEALLDACIRAEYKYFGTFLFRALSGVDTALWDLRGKAAGRPVYQLLGGSVRDRIPIYASSMSREIAPGEEVDRIEQGIQEYGFRCAKIKIGARNGRDAELLRGRTRELVPLARKRLGDDIELSADANGAYSPGQAVRIGRLLEEYGYFHLEEPNPMWELDNMGYVADKLDIPIGAGEQEFSLEIIRRMVAERLVDVIQPDVCYVGGLTRAKRVADLAELNGIPCTPHSSGHSLIQVFTAHLVAASPACTQYLEWSIEKPGDPFWGPMPVARDGFIELDDAPGWGIELAPAFLERADRQESALV
jgi:L-alanine-DL-glutamate epimerase-like enolase superfamily enzyme